VLLLLFSCLVAPEQGDATPFEDVRQVLAQLPADHVDRFQRHGGCCAAIAPQHLSLNWRTAFAADPRPEVLAYCTANRIDAPSGRR
jgi:hypothetical protein